MSLSVDFTDHTCSLVLWKGDLSAVVAAVVIALGAAGSVTLTQHADQHRPERLVVLAVDQELDRPRAGVQIHHAYRSHGSD